MEGITPPPAEKCKHGYTERLGYYDGEAVSTFNGSEEECKKGCDILKEKCSAYQYSTKYEFCALIKGNILPRLKKKYDEYFFCTKGKML